ncbi:MAG: 16S rRNA (cytosine(1402)-N(4))-methyltransferase RsmH [Geitlerinemataceae cyanobacterium]
MTRTDTLTSDREDSTTFEHISVLGEELIEGLEICPGGYYLDATVGAGGHSRSILTAADDTRVMAIDRDEQALATAAVNLAPWRSRVEFWQGNFADFPVGERKFDGIIADLGVSSGQLDRPERGFSFRQTAPLDMRMDRQQSLTAAEIVNHWDEKELADLIYQYGEERFSRRIARQIVQQRPLQTTTELAEAIARSVPRHYRYARIHSATRTFQALRIAVNQELASLETFLDKATGLLNPGGRVGVISFHSLEDRRVKYHFRDCEQLRVVTKKPIVPQVEEQDANPRSRSAKLRFAERLEEPSMG